MYYSSLFVSDKPLYFENFDLDSVVTPVNIKRFKQLLDETGYDKKKSEYLIEGFTNGFDIGYRGNEKVKLQAQNLKLNGGPGDKLVLWNKVMKEVHEKQYVGPFQKIPYEYYIQSPIGLIPKDNGCDSRLIFHLSYPRGKGFSLNQNTLDHMCSVQYPDFNRAIELCQLAGIGCKLSKSDMKSAFRNLGILERQWKYLVMTTQSPIDDRWYFFIDKHLPFGAAISCAVFQAFSNAIAHIVRVKSRKDNVNYLDDFLFIAMLKALCDAQVDLFLSICHQINFPVFLEKTFYGTTQLVFLGLLIDTVCQLVLIPMEKVKKARDLISDALQKAKGKIKVKHLQAICGYLNFLGKCILPGRAFTR